MAVQKVDIHEVVTAKIIEALENGTVPWRKPWKDVGGLPISLTSMKPYRGVNVWTLLITSHAEGYTSPYWATYNQVKARGGHVKKGEKGTQVVLYKRASFKKQNDAGEDEEKGYMLLQYFTVFNADQTEDMTGLPEVEAAVEFDPIERCEEIVVGMPQLPEIKTGGNIAGYAPFLDYITMPYPSQFDGAERYYATLFHEMAHSTAHESRLKRPDANETNMRTESYSKEELVAEMTSAFLCGEADIINETIEASAAYVANWLKKLKDDRKLLVKAASDAAKATDWILNRKAAAVLTPSPEAAMVSA